VRLEANVVARVGALWVTVFLFQVSVVPHFRVAGYIIDLPLIVVALVTLHLNAQSGSLVGFLAGLVMDLVLQTPFGMTALTFSLLGFTAGSVSPHLTQRNAITRALVVALLAATATTLFASFGAVIGLEYVTRRELGAIALVTAVAAVPLACVLSPLVRWTLALRFSPITSSR